MIKKLVLILVLVLLGGCVKQTIQENQEQKQLIGGQRDEHGCLGPAGYSWDDSARACIRSFELDDFDKYVARMAVDIVGQQKGLTVVKIIKENIVGCKDCVVVQLDLYGEKKEILLEHISKPE